ncbi:MAG: IS200/IS605 family element transposase accessory protein TnpB [Candidatus Verstraetearchaeota archaeon]|nr:IS200/IS605 family element transposase accessory protein TnpB [Candidatus Verstraetearchaeota archaeon]
MRVRATARIEAVAPERGEGLIEFLRAYRGAVQEIVNELWRLKKAPSKATLHSAYYNELRSRGFRAHHASEIYKRAREIVEATKGNGGSRPLLRKLTARIHPLDYKIDLNTKTLRIAVLDDEWVELKLKWYSYLDEYLDGSWRLGEVLVSYKHDKVSAYLVFNKEVQLREPKAVMGIDLNFDNATCTIVGLDGNLITIHPLPYRGLKRALHLKKLAEQLQKEHPKSWRSQKWVNRARARWLRRARNVLMDSAHYLAKRLIKIAEEYEAYIAFESLKRVGENGNRGDDLAWELQLWCYRRVQEFTKYKALIKGLKTIPVNPKNTSRQSPNGRPLKFIDYKTVELGGIVTSRDVIASWNIALRGLKKLRRGKRREERRVRGFRVTWSPDGLACEGVRTRPNARNPEAIDLSTIV